MYFEGILKKKGFVISGEINSRLLSVVAKVLRETSQQQIERVKNVLIGNGGNRCFLSWNARDSLSLLSHFFLTSLFCHECLAIKARSHTKVWMPCRHIPQNNLQTTARFV